VRLLIRVWGVVVVAVLAAGVELLLLDLGVLLSVLLGGRCELGFFWVLPRSGSQLCLPLWSRLGQIRSGCLALALDIVLFLVLALVLVRSCLGSCLERRRLECLDHRLLLSLGWELLWWFSPSLRQALRLFLRAKCLDLLQ
jgi:hypothetical protein